ncbi:hypothetical protein ABZW02_29720 [Streptomyces sp. NPDC005180]|uniref:hypothetical protein n=1 Tax=Streptomyces sp. NPDC005180 TaxID=3156868 RepID=UPI0033BA1C98
MTGLSPDGLRTLCQHTAGLLDSDQAVVVLDTEHDGKALLAAAVTRNLHDTSIDASRILIPDTRTVGGGASGKGPVASAGGRRTEALGEALTVAAQGCCPRPRRVALGWPVPPQDAPAVHVINRVRPAPAPS